MLSPSLFFTLEQSSHPELFEENAPVWQALAKLKEYMNNFKYPTLSHPKLQSGLPTPEHLVWYNNTLSSLDECTIEFGDAGKGKLLIYRNDIPLEGASLIMAGSILQGEQIFIGQGSLIEGGATIKSPAIIGDNCEVRQGAYLRGYTLAENRCVLGHSTEIKHSIMLNDAKAGHFNYLGDSILGNKTNLGAGTKLANLRFLPGNVTITHEKKRIDSGLRKFGAILGDGTQTGCNAVTSPGTVLGKRSIVMPNSTSASGFYPAGSRI